MTEGNRRREDEWFLRNEEKLLESARVAREKREKERASREREEERKRLKEQHLMRCPKCGHEMREAELEGINVDQCSFCEGIYLDAGELGQLFLKREEERRGFLRRVLGI